MSQGSPGTKLRPPSTRPGGNSTSTNTRRSLIPLILGLLVVLALIVVFVLPAQLNKPVETHSESPPAAVPNTTIPVVPPQPQNPIAEEDAQSALQAFLRLRAQTIFDSADIWASKDWQKALSLADEGDALFGQGKFQAAGASYEAATQQLTDLQNARPEILSNMLKTAQKLLQNNDAEAAIESFEKVLLMQENHPQATLKLTQAKARNAVLQKMQQGQQAVDGNHLQKAKAAYTEALVLDPTYAPADLALNAVQDTIDKQAYQAAMSNALDNLQSQRFADAGRALDTAAKIRPDSTEIKDARQRLKLAVKQARMDRLRSQSGKMASAEQWAKAVALYQKALAIEPQAGFALSGLSHAKARLALHQQLDHYLNDPQRLSSDEPLANAQTLIKSSRPLRNDPVQAQNEPQLSAKLSALENAIEQATLPVSLVIESDELTKISIYHVGQLGQFGRKQLTLRPGRYTLVGSRAGYRDVRKVIDLRPNTPLQLLLMCEEAI